MNDDKALKGRAKRKSITQSVALSLIDASKAKGDPEHQQAYWNTYHCQSKVHSSNGKLYGKYCKNRICTICCSIRKADIINRYLQEVETWEDPFFLTLTIKAVSAQKLNSRLEAMIRGFRKIKDKHRKRYQRGKGIKLVGVKSLECNFNPKQRTYNPIFTLSHGTKKRQ